MPAVLQQLANISKSLEKSPSPSLLGLELSSSYISVVTSLGLAHRQANQCVSFQGASASASQHRQVALYFSSPLLVLLGSSLPPVLEILAFGPGNTLKNHLIFGGSAKENKALPRKLPRVTQLVSSDPPPVSSSPPLVLHTWPTLWISELELTFGV